MSRPYKTRRWQRLRAKVLAAEPVCRACIVMASTTPAPSVHVDHITPISAGGDVWSMDNLQGLCASHHSIKTGYDMRGTAWTEWERRGCNPDGSPRDPAHPWYTA